MMWPMTSRDFRELMELSERLHRATQVACERSRASCSSVLSALSEFNRDVGLTDVDLDWSSHRLNGFPRLSRGGDSGRMAEHS
jgi:hypothetical protein